MGSVGVSSSGSPYDRLGGLLDRGVQPASIERYSVMVADATYPMAEIKGTALRSAGVRSVRLSAGLAHSIECLKRQTFDLILVDEMVTPTGFASFVAQIRDQNPGRNAHTPILVAAAHLDEALMRLANGAHISLVLQKPFSGNDIRSKIAQLMSRKAYQISPKSVVEEVLL